MKGSYRLITLSALVLSAAPLAAQTPREDNRAAAAANSRTRMPVVIPAGTPLTVAIDQDLSSQSVNAGQRISFHLTSDYSEFGHVLISSGTPVRGTGDECGSPEIGWKTRSVDDRSQVRTSRQMARTYRLPAHRKSPERTARVRRPLSEFSRSELARPRRDSRHRSPPGRSTRSLPK